MKTPSAELSLGPINKHGVSCREMLVNGVQI